MTSSEQIAATLTLPYLNHAVRMLESGYASRTDIDAAMRFGCGYPRGPLTMVDSLGPKVVRDELAARYAGTRDERHRPADLLEKLVSEGGTFADRAAEAEPPSQQLRHHIGRVGVVGTGTMACGIAQVFAQAGYDVVCVGRTEEKTAAVTASLRKGLAKLVEKGRLDEPGREAVLGRLSCATSREGLADADLVVEAVAEDLTVKTRLFEELDRVCRPGAILATTTSSLPVTRLAGATSRRESVIGMHFFNPAPVMKLVEVVTTGSTTADVAETVKALCAKVGKVAVSCGDRPGFIVNCLLFPYLNDAVKLHESGIAIEAVDAAIKEHAGFPMGPFELLDVVGNDVSLAIQQELHAEFGEPGLAPAALLEQKVGVGELGRKTGRGFHAYG